MPRYFHTGIGKKPFTFNFSSVEFVIHPPDKHWKRVKVPYEIERVKRANGEEVVRLGYRHDWEVDNDGRVNRKRCINYLDVTDEQAKVLWEKKREERADFIKSDAQMSKEMDAEMDAELDKHETAMRTMKEERLKMQLELESMKQEFETKSKELDKAIKNQLKK